MPYVKPQFLVQDMPLTFQMVNVVQDDLYDGWLQFAKWHGTVEPLVNSFGISGVPAPPALLYGSHNDKRIPRATVRIYASTLSSGSVSSPIVVTSTPGVFGGALRQQVGVVDVVVNLDEYYADCTPFGVGLSGNLRFVVPTSIYPNQGAVGALRFELFERNAVSGAFEPADFNFSASIYGTP